MFFRLLGGFLFVQSPTEEFKHTPCQRKHRNHKELDQPKPIFHYLSTSTVEALSPGLLASRSRFKFTQAQLTNGGIELRIVSILPPV